MNGSLSPAQIIAKLNDTSQYHLENILSHTDEVHESSDWKISSNRLIFNTLFDADRYTGIKSLCNFSATEFNELQKIIMDYENKTEALLMAINTLRCKISLLCFGVCWSTGRSNIFLQIF